MSSSTQGLVYLIYLGGASIFFGENKSITGAKKIAYGFRWNCRGVDNERNGRVGKCIEGGKEVGFLSTAWEEELGEHCKYLQHRAGEGLRREASCCVWEIDCMKMCLLPRFSWVHHFIKHKHPLTIFVICVSVNVSCLVTQVLLGSPFHHWWRHHSIRLCLLVKRYGDVSRQPLSSPTEERVFTEVHLQSWVTPKFGLSPNLMLLRSSLEKREKDTYTVLTTTHYQALSTTQNKKYAAPVLPIWSPTIVLDRPDGA